MNRIRIAIVEDHNQLREAVILFLKEKGGIDVIIQTANGKDLLNKLQSETVDVIVMGIQMPVINGIETLAQLKKQFPNIKIVIFSMLSDKAIIRNLKKSGINSFVSKGSPEILADTIKEVFRNGVSYNFDFKPCI